MGRRHLHAADAGGEALSWRAWHTADVASYFSSAGHNSAGLDACRISKSAQAVKTARGRDRVAAAAWILQLGRIALPIKQIYFKCLVHCTVHVELLGSCTCQFSNSFHQHRYLRRLGGLSQRSSEYQSASCQMPRVERIPRGVVK